MKSVLIVFLFIALCAAVSLAAFVAVESGGFLRVYLLAVVLPVLWYILRALVEFLNQPPNTDGLRYSKTFTALTIAFIFFTLLCFYFVIKSKRPRPRHKSNSVTQKKNLINSISQKPKKSIRGKKK